MGLLPGAASSRRPASEPVLQILALATLYFDIVATGVETPPKQLRCVVVPLVVMLVLVLLMALMLLMVLLLHRLQPSGFHL